MRLFVENNSLVVELTSKEKFFAFKHGLSIPLDHIVSVAPGVPARRWRFRAPGTFFPGVIRAGTYYTGKGKEFWYFRRGEEYQTYTIELRNEPYRCLILSLKSIPPDLETLLKDA